MLTARQTTKDLMEPARRLREAIDVAEAMEIGAPGSQR
jgi:hypothetical protein